MEYRDITIKGIVKLYSTVKRNTIYALRLKGLTFSEISRRIGGSTKPVVMRIFKEVEKEEEDAKVKAV